MIAREEHSIPEAASVIVQAIDNEINKMGDAIVLWSGGNSPKMLLAEIRGAPIRWERVTFIMADERWVPLSSTLSNEGEMRRYIRGTDLDNANVIGLYDHRGARDDLIGDIDRRVRGALNRPACISLQGVGADGHTASLFSGKDWLRSDDGKLVVSTNGPDESVRERVSLTPFALRSAAIVALLVNTREKSVVWRQALADGTESNFPVSIYSQLDQNKLILVS